MKQNIELAILRWDLPKLDQKGANSNINLIARVALKLERPKLSNILHLHISYKEIHV